jgi:hypothetical protein
MNSTTNAQVLSSIPGRARLRLPGWNRDEDGPWQIEAGLRGLPGVTQAAANPLTGSVLVRFDPRVMTENALLSAVNRCQREVEAQRALEREGAQRAAQVDGNKLVRAGLRGMIAHAVFDTFFYTVIFSEPFGLPLAALGFLHVPFDAVAWSIALVPLLAELAPARPSSDYAAGQAAI